MRPALARAVCLAVILTAAWVDAAAPAGPAEAPPASFAGDRYVDSRGCVFLRAGRNGEVTWVSRLDAGRRPMCGQEPTLAGGAAMEDALPWPAPAAPPMPGAAPAPPPDGKAGSGSAPAPFRVRPAMRLPAGYKPAWDDGRLNPLRGPRTPEGDRQMRRYFDSGRVPMPQALPGDSRHEASARFWVQAGSHVLRRDAEIAARRLRQMGIPAVIGRVGGAAGSPAAVLAGPFPAEAEARAAAAVLRAAGMEVRLLRG